MIKSGHYYENKSKGIIVLATSDENLNTNSFDYIVVKTDDRYSNIGRCSVYSTNLQEYKEGELYHECTSCGFCEVDNPFETKLKYQLDDNTKQTAWMIFNNMLNNYAMAYSNKDNLHKVLGVDKGDIQTIIDDGNMINGCLTNRTYFDKLIEKLETITE